MLGRDLHRRFFSKIHPVFAPIGHEQVPTKVNPVVLNLYKLSDKL